MSLEMAAQFNATLKGEVPVKEALETLQRKLQEIVDQGQRGREAAPLVAAFRYLFNINLKPGLSMLHCGCVARTRVSNTYRTLPPPFRLT